MGTILQEKPLLPQQSERLGDCGIDRNNCMDNTEGSVTKKIEQHTSKIPSDTFLWAAVGSMAASATLKLCGRKHDALFVGQWAAPFLLLGLYNKLVKVAGHDSLDRGELDSDAPPKPIDD